MEEKNEAGKADPKPENTRAGGPDFTRAGTEHKEAPAEDQDNVPRSAPVDSDSGSR